MVICKKRLWSVIGAAGCLIASVCAEELTVDFRTLVTATELTSATVTAAITNDYHFSSLEIAISAKNGSGATQSFGDANGYGLRVWNGTDDRWWDAGGGGEQLRFVFTVRDQNNDRVSANVHVHSLFYRRAAGTGSRVLFDGGDGAADLLIEGGSAQALSEPYVVNTGDALTLTRSGTDQIFQLAGMVVSFSETDSTSQSVIQLSDPTISTHLFTAGAMRLGITDNGGGFVNHVSVDGGATDLMATEAAYGRGWQGSVRDNLHGGRYNPTQAGFRDEAGAPVTLAEEDGRLKILSYNMPLYSDAVFDFTVHEDLAPDYEKYNDGLNEDSSPIGDPYTGDTDALDEPADWTQDDEVRSEFDFEGFYENAVSQAGGQVSAVRFFQRYSYVRDPGPIYQFGPGALRMDGEDVYNASVIASSGDISSTLAGVQTATEVDMAGVIFTSYGIRFTAANGYVNKMWYSGGEWHAEAMDLGNENVNYKLPGSGITPTESDPLDYGFLMVTDGTDPSTSYGFALYVPMTEVNSKCTVGINQADGSVAYRENRLTDCKILYSSATPTQVSIRARYNLRGLLAPAHGDPDVYEALESDQYVLYGTPEQILAAVQTLEAELLSGAESVHGTPTSWLDAYGLDDEEGDADGDGTPNWSEYLAGTSPVDAAEGAAPKTFMDFQFNTDGDFEGWTHWANFTDATVSNGVLSGRSTTTDPYVYSTDYTVDSDAISTVYVKLKGEQTGQSVFYWKLGTQYKWLVNNYTTANEWQILSFDVGASASWTGLVSLLRVDPFSASNAVFSIDWIISSDGDQDNDGVPDAGEGLGDTDGDGIEDFRDPGFPPLVVGSLAVSNGASVDLWLDGLAGQSYLLQRTTNLVEPEWISVQTIDPLSQDQTLQLMDENPPDDGAFYRVLRLGM
jgi:hypothetical protein